MRILHLSVLYPPIIQGGAELFAATLAEAQAKKGHDVGVITLGRQAEAAHQQNGVQVHRISHGNLFWLHDWPQYPAALRYAHKFFASWNPVLRHRVGRIIDSFRPDIINSHCMVGFSVDCWKEATLRDVPVVHALHEFNLFCRNTNAFRNDHVCKSVCLACRITEPKRWYSRNVFSVIGVSHDVLQRHIDLGFFSHIPPNRRTVIWSMPPIAIRSRPSRPADSPFTIGFIGRIVREKGLETLLDAVRRIAVEHPQLKNWRLKVAGKVFPPLDENALRNQAAGLPVEWLGQVPAAEFYQDIDILVVPAIWADPGPLVVHEAFANAIPVIGAAIGGITDLVEQDVTGWLYPPGDVSALSAILAARIGAGRSALLPEAAFSRFRSETRPERVAERYEDFYRLTTEDYRNRQRTSG
jgi:glycosyltransferase involved in cell wall biosynthesis